MFPVADLASLVLHLTGEAPISPFVYTGEAPCDDVPGSGVDLQHVRGQEHVKRGLEVAAAGGHN